MKMISLDSIPERTAKDKEIDRMVQAGRSSVIRWMGLKRKSSGRVGDYLRKQGFDPEIIPLVIASLQEDKTIDDERLARAIIQQRQGRQKESVKALASRLSGMGIDPMAIEHVLGYNQSIEEDQKSALSLFRQYFGHLLDDLLAEQDHLDEIIFKQKYAQLIGKAARFLSNRGFSEEIISDTFHHAGLLTDGLE